MEELELLDQMDLLDLVVNEEIQVPKVLWDQLERKDCLDNQDLLVLMVSLVILDHQVLLEFRAMPVQQVPLVKLVTKDSVVILEQADRQGRQDHRDKGVMLDLLDHLVKLDQMDQLVIPVLQVTPDQLDLQDNLETLDHLDRPV
jgi:hypothetical protein